MHSSCAHALSALYLWHGKYKYIRYRNIYSLAGKNQTPTWGSFAKKYSIKLLTSVYELRISCIGGLT